MEILDDRQRLGEVMAVDRQCRNEALRIARKVVVGPVRPGQQVDGDRVVLDAKKVERDAHPVARRRAPVVVKDGSGHGSLPGSEGRLSVAPPARYRTAGTRGQALRGCRCGSPAFGHCDKKFDYLVKIRPNDIRRTRTRETRRVPHAIARDGAGRKRASFRTREEPRNRTSRALEHPAFAGDGNVAPALRPVSFRTLDRHD